MTFYVFQYQVEKREHLKSNNKILNKTQILIFLIPIDCYNSKKCLKGNQL